ncbi:MAG: PDZ domain-containing protein [Alphaproteobacteria bacterium]|nr:PDZ domain-containing protein [Alphaproteobacteria bacterium]
MRLVTSLLIILATTVFMPLEASADRGLKVPLRANEKPGAAVSEEVELYGSSHALVVGIDNYTNGWPRLSNAIADARAVADELRRKGFNVTLKTDLKSSQLEQAFKAFFINKGGDPNARLFVWFAGHGHTENGEGFLIPADAPRPEVGRKFKFAALPTRRFGEYVRLAESKHAFAVFDSCFSGTVFDGARALPPAAVTRATTLPVRQFLTSGDAGQTVSDDGTFRKLFLRALRGEERVDANDDGFITASEMGLFLGGRVTNLTRSKQTPRYGKLRDADWDRGDFVFSISKTSFSPTRKKTATPQAGTTPEMMFWQSIQNSRNPDSYQAYLTQYPSGAFAPLAKLKIKELKPPKIASRASTAAPKPAIPPGARPWLGVKIQQVTDEMAQTLGMARARGALIAEAIKDSPGTRSGLKSGDVILSFGRHNITKFSELPRLIGQEPAGSEVIVKVWRGGRIKTIAVTLGALEAEGGMAKFAPEPGALGFSILHTSRGIEIGNIAKGSAAEQRGLRPGETVLTVDRKPAGDTEEFARLVNLANQAGRNAVLLRLKNESGERFVTIPLPKKKTTPPKTPKPADDSPIPTDDQDNNE